MTSAFSLTAYQTSLTILLDLMRKAGQAPDLEALGFLIVNETRLLVPYRQAALWCSAPGQGRIIALSGAAIVDPDAPYPLWLTRLFHHLATTHGKTPLQILTAADFPKELTREWHDWLPEYILWLPLAFPDDHLRGGVMLAHHETWSELAQQLLIDFSGVMAMAMAGMLSQRPWSSRLAGNRFFTTKPLAITLLLMAVLALPVRQSVLAPAQVVAAEPVMVRATMDGVIDRFQISPNETVRKDQPLLTLHGARLRGEREVADKEREVIQAEYRQAAQKSLWDQQSKSQAEVLKRKVAQKEAESAYLTQRMERLIVRAPQDGVAIFNDVNDWIGRPVVTGETLLMVADPDRAALRIDLAVADAITVNPGAEMELFLNTSPDTALPAILRHASFEPEITPEGVLAYRLYADFSDPARRPPRLGLRGTVRIYRPERILLIRMLFRRPLALARQWIGF